MVVGEISYHEALEARSHGLAVVVGGHYPTEAPAVEILAGYCRAGGGEGVEVFLAERERNPFLAC